MRHQLTRLQILTDEHEQVVEDWMAEHVSADRLDNWGAVDISPNPLSDICRQLSTPGLYGTEPGCRHRDPRAAELTSRLEAGGYWTKMQTVQYRTLGIGDYILAPSIEGESGLQFQLVDPHRCMMVTDSAQPDRPLAFREHRVLWDEAFERWEHVWFVHDRTDPARPQRRVELVHAADPNEVDVTARFAPAWLDEQYPWMSPTKGPLIPYVIYRSVDAGRPWNHLEKRGAARGTLTAIMNWTATGNCAIDASGQMVLVAGLEPMREHVDIPADGTGRQVLSIQVTPGVLAYHRIIPGATPFVKEIGPGAHLQTMADYAAMYEAKQLVRWGLGNPEAQRKSSNPSSAAALYISNSQKREYAGMIEPLFRRADMEMLRLCSAMLRTVGIDTPEEGYSITYPTIPLSPDELRAEREDMEWEVAQGLKSRVDLYQERNPGASREHALQELARVRADEMAIQAAATALNAGTESTP